MLALLVPALIACTAYAVFAVAMYLGQHRLVYRIDPRRVAPSRVKLAGVDEITIAAAGGGDLVGWYGAAAAGKPTLVYFHGQSGNLARRSERVRRYRAEGFGFLMVAYRGFSGSAGQPSEKANVADGHCVLNWLAAAGVPPENIVLYGESLGTGVAAQLAGLRKVAAVVLDSPFTSLADIAARRHPWLPVRSFLLDRYETLVHAAKITAPVLILHGEDDPIIPLHMGTSVFAALPGPKRLISFAGGRHLDHGRYGSFDAVVKFLRECPRLPQGYCMAERVVAEVGTSEPAATAEPMRA